MLDTGRGDERLAAADADFVQFWRAGENVVGEFRCAECGYGVAITRQLPRCPMCSGEVWESGSWSPLARARSEATL